jgi:hypothetical protein
MAAKAKVREHRCVCGHRVTSHFDDSRSSDCCFPGCECLKYEWDGIENNIRPTDQERQMSESKLRTALHLRATELHIDQNGSGFPLTGYSLCHKYTFETCQSPKCVSAREALAAETQPAPDGSTKDYNVRQNVIADTTEVKPAPVYDAKRNQREIDVLFQPPPPSNVSAEIAREWRLRKRHGLISDKQYEAELAALLDRAVTQTISDITNGQPGAWLTPAAQAALLNRMALDQLIEARRLLGTGQENFLRWLRMRIATLESKQKVSGGS